MTILKMSFSASIFILVIALIRVIALYRLPKKTFLALWSVALFRLFVPLSIPSQFNIFTILIRIKTFHSTDLHMPQNVLNLYAEADFIPTLTTDSKAGILPVIMFWLLGLSTCSLFFLITHFRCLREYKTSLPVSDEFVNRWRQEHKTWRKIDIRQSDQISTALTYGLFRPVVLLPKTTDWTDETKSSFILTHEYAHIQNFHILLKWLLSASVCIHWFNPLVWFMYTLANCDIELACDETVVWTFGETAKASYALTLIEFAERKIVFTPFMNNFSKNTIKERTKSIMKTKRISLTAISFAFILTLCIVILFATDSVPVEGGNIDTVTSSTSKSALDNFLTNSVNYVKSEESLNLGNGIASAHDVRNGHLVVYKLAKKNGELAQGEKVHLQVDIEDILEDGQTAVIGYILDDVYTDIYSGKIKNSKSIEFSAPETGEYAFYFIGASSDTIHVQSLSIG